MNNIQLGDIARRIGAQVAPVEAARVTREFDRFRERAPLGYAMRWEFRAAHVAPIDIFADGDLMTIEVEPRERFIAVGRDRYDDREPGNVYPPPNQGNFDDGVARLVDHIDRFNLLRIVAVTLNNSDLRTPMLECDNAWYAHHPAVDGVDTHYLRDNVTQRVIDHINTTATIVYDRGKVIENLIELVADAVRCGVATLMEFAHVDIGEIDIALVMWNDHADDDVTVEFWHADDNYTSDVAVSRAVELLRSGYTLGRIE